VQNADGTLTMMFAGYRLPKTISAVGTSWGTGSTPYVIGATDPTAYRNILVETLAGPPTTATVTGAVTVTGGAADPNACVPVPGGQYRCGVVWHVRAGQWFV
jgi:hypothetical protein